MRYDISLTELLSRECADTGELRMVATSTKAKVQFDRVGGWLFVDTEEPGLVGVAVWRNTRIEGAEPEPFAFALVPPVGHDTGNIRLITPNSSWRFVKGGNGELECVDDDEYTIEPDERGYFECFTDSEFTQYSHLQILLTMASAAPICLDWLREMYSDGGGVTYSARLIKDLAILLFGVNEGATRLHADLADRDQCMLEAAAWLDSLLLKEVDTNPLRALVASKTPEVAALAKQVAGHVDAGFEALEIEPRGGFGYRIEISPPLLTCQAMRAYRPDLAPPESA